MRHALGPKPAAGGFTLIELMVVIAVVGLLVGALIPVAGKLLGDAKKTKAQSDARAIVDAIAMYKQYYGAYPPGNQNNPNYNYGYSGVGYGVEALNPWLVNGSPKFLSKAIGNDPWGTPYNYHIYTLSNPYQDVVVFSSGPDKTNNSWDGGVWNTGKFNGDDIGAFYDEES